MNEKITIPDDIKIRLIKFSEEQDIPPKRIMAKLKEILNTDKNIQAMDNPLDKIRYAHAIFMRGVYNGNIKFGKPIDFRDPKIVVQIREIKETQYGLLFRGQVGFDENFVNGLKKDFIRKQFNLGKYKIEKEES